MTAVLAIVTSTYRASAFLEAYAARVQATLARLRLSCLWVVVANEPTPAEDDGLRALQAVVEAGGHRFLRVDVPRETVYASWHRGVMLSDTPYFTVWNVDDDHTPESLEEGVRLLQEGYTLVEFAYHERRKDGVHLRQPNLHAGGQIRRKGGLSPFWVMSRALYEQVGAFDGRYRIAGDFEWSIRALPHARYIVSDVLGGTFDQRDDNLSGTGNARQELETVTALLQARAWSEVVPVSPDGLRELWQAWGLSEASLPPTVQAWLWGRGAGVRWLCYRALRRVPALWRAYRALVVRGLAPSFELRG
jgi:hypothetical protein